MAAESHFRAMGTDVHLLLVGSNDDALERACARIADLEARWSRFVPTSEVSRLNDNAGFPTVCSPETVTLVGRALDAWRFTDGRFDPTVLGAVRRAGYNASFDALPSVRSHVGGDEARTTGAADIDVDAATKMVVIPRGVGFDPGGIGKGLAADIVSDEAIAAGACGVCVNIGGDLRVRGSAPDGGAWGIDVLDPVDARRRAVVALQAGAVATSSRARRAWFVGDRAQHHLVDPSTGLPVFNDVVAATVVASEGWRAEVLAKAVFVAGADDGLAFLDRAGAAGVVFGTDGAMHPSTDWHRFVTGGVSGLSDERTRVVHGTTRPAPAGPGAMSNATGRRSAR
jgi:thiamine biosynthesis lipoprotein